MDDMRELVTVAGFQQALLAAAAVWTVACVALGLARRGRPAGRVALLSAVLGPLVCLLWFGYCWTVRVDPQTGYVGLHRVSVFALNGLVFVLVGGLAGYLIGRVARSGRTGEGD